MYQITVETTFSAAHALRLADGTTEPTHGHDWRVAVTVASYQLDAVQTVMDFHQLRHIVDDVIVSFRNRNLNDVEPFAAGEINPSAERVAWWIGTRTQERLPDGAQLVSTRVGEAPGCTATFRP